MNSYIGVSYNLPQTSYVKMIDVWFIFSMMIPFIEVLLQTYIEHLRYKLDLKEANQKTRVKEFMKEVKR